ncbi:hypothetical protein EVB91_188 [Rhizobium phage RHph_I1_18]|nr:hypothetical protein EVB91_188 [Rhizobium phage RHph_I1_18]
MKVKAEDIAFLILVVWFVGALFHFGLWGNVDSLFTLIGTGMMSVMWPLTWFVKLGVWMR